MKLIVTCLMTLSMIGTSQLAVAQQYATKQQIDQIITFEQWDQIKTALKEQNLPNLKSTTENYLLKELNLNHDDLSANQQVTIQQISDIIINDMVDNIDMQQLIKDVNQAYQHLTYEQATALIKIYQQPALKDSGEKLPKITAQILDLSSDEYDTVMQLDEIKKIIGEYSNP